jgi:hypothetical protein
LIWPVILGLLQIAVFGSKWIVLLHKSETAQHHFGFLPIKSFLSYVSDIVPNRARNKGQIYKKSRFHRFCVISRSYFLVHNQKGEWTAISVSNAHLFPISQIKVWFSSFLLLANCTTGCLKDSFS